MNLKETIISILENRGMRKIDLANNVGITKQVLNIQITRNNDWYISTAIKWLDGCGYKLVAMPKELPLPKDSYELK